MVDLAEKKKIKNRKFLVADIHAKVLFFKKKFTKLSLNFKNPLFKTES